MPHTYIDIQQQQRYWRRTVLIPLWCQQIMIQLCAGVFFWMIISNFWRGIAGHGPGDGNKAERGVLGTFFLLYVFLLLTTVGEIALYLVGYLHSGGYLFMQIVKTGSSVLIWSVLFIYPFVVLDSKRQPVEASIFMGVFVFFLQIPMLCALIHAILIKHEERTHHFVWDEVQPARNEPATVDVEVAETTPLLGGGGYRTMA